MIKWENKKGEAMNLKIVKDYIPKGRKNRPGYKLTPKYVTIHNTANPNATA